MIIVAAVSVGPLDGLSYQYNSKLVLENLARNFDKVYVISSSRRTRGLPIKTSNITFVSDETSWFDLDEYGNEALTMVKIKENVQRIWNLAQTNGDDFLVNICINQYIDDENALKMRNYCEKLRSEDKPFGFLYKAYQIRDKICYPDVKLPWVINLKHKEYSDIKDSEDAIYYKGQQIRIESGFYDNPPFYITDIFLEMTEKDFYDRYDYYLKHLNMWAHGDEGVRDWEIWRKYYISKAKRKVINFWARLTVWGTRALNNIPEGSLVKEIEFNFCKNFCKFLIHKCKNIVKRK